MRKAWLWLGVIVVALLAGAAWNREALIRLHAVNTLFAEDRIVENFTDMARLFHSVPLSRGDGPVSALPPGEPLDLPPDFEAWAERRAVMGFVMLVDGRIVAEAYRLGTDPGDRFISWSVAKSFLSALFGITVADGAIASLDDPVTDYAPALAGGAYDGATIRNVLQMSSGVEFDEDYDDFWSDINKMGRVLALGQSMDGFAAGLTGRIGPPGARWQYVSIDTHVLGMVLRGATGRSVPDLMQEKLIAPLGLEADPYYITDGYGTAFVLGGLNLTARDYARMGQMILQDGAFNGTQIVPVDWVRESTRPSAPTTPGRIRYGYQWWIPADANPGEVLARGVYGQYLYIDRRAGAVIVVTAADRAFLDDGAFADTLQMLRRLSEQAREQQND